MPRQKRSRERVVAASEFARNFGRYKDEALSGHIINVTSHGRIVGAFVSSRALEDYLRLKRRQREILIVGELPEDVVSDIQAAEYGKLPR